MQQMMKCPHCGKQTPVDSDVCAECGKPLKQSVRIEQFLMDLLGLTTRRLYAVLGFIAGVLLACVVLYPIASLGYSPFVTQDYLKARLGEVRQEIAVNANQPLSTQVLALQSTTVIEPTAAIAMTAEEMPTTTPVPTAAITPSPTSPPTDTPLPTDTPVPTPIPTDTPPLTQLQPAQTWRQGGLTAQVYTYNQVVDECEGSAGARWNIWAVWRIVIKNETDGVSNIQLTPNNFEARDGSGRSLKLFMLRDEFPGCSFNPSHPRGANVEVSGLGPGEEVRVRVYGIQDAPAGASFRFVITSAGPIVNAVWELPLVQ